MLNRDKKIDVLRMMLLAALLCVTLPFFGENPDNAPAVPSNMVLVEGGSFTMGNKDGYGDEKQIHEVTVSSFYMGKCEVTQKEWQAVMGNNPSHFKGDDLPVDTVSWYDAIEFCNRLSKREGLTPVYSGSGDDIRMDRKANGYRLPTEAEWEYAAGGGKKREGYKYAGSKDIDSVAWYWVNSGDQKLNGEWDYDKIDKNGGRTREAGRKGANGLGLYDMSGNVWEWCWDKYGEYKNEPQTDPAGFASGSYRVRRGGSWRGSADLCRVTSRSGDSPGIRNLNIGFRLVRTAG